MIDHRTTARDHPQADGLSERIVQVLKKGLHKFCIDSDHRMWHTAVPWLPLGYRMSRHSALADFSPYLLMFGRDPLLPTSTTRVMDQSLDLDDPQLYAASLAQRAAILRKAVPMALQHLGIAQHRDSLRYARTRYGDYRPRIHVFSPGQPVYYKRQTRDTIDVPTTRVILRVVHVRKNGSVLLQGQCGRKITDHVKNIAPCHLPNVDTEIRPDSAVFPAVLSLAAYVAPHMMGIACSFVSLVSWDSTCGVSSRHS